jgi:predicted aldo/keto reductase-like oxidoreductase
MNSLKMVRENCRIASKAKAGSFTEEDHKTLAKIKKIIAETEKVGCTGCGYCMPCPKGVDIPVAFLAYNRLAFEKKNQVRIEYLQNTGLRKETAFASQCIGCGKCEKHCPQGIHIRDELENVKKRLENPVFKVAAAVAKMISKK